MSQSILNNNHGGDLCMIESYAYETDAGKYQFLVEALRSGNQRIIGVSYSSNSRLFDTLAPTPALITSLLAGHDCTDAAADHSNLYSSSNYSHHSNGALTNAALSRDEKRALQALIRPFVPVPILEGQDSSDMKRGLAEIRETTTMFMKVNSTRIG